MQLLRLLGLKKDLNQAAFRACAEEVEAWDLADMGPEQKAEALAAARELVQELTSSPSLQGTSLYHAIRDIAFVPASVVRGCPTIHLLSSSCVPCSLSAEQVYAVQISIDGGFAKLLLHTLHDVHRTRIATWQATHHCMRKGLTVLRHRGCPEAGRPRPSWPRSPRRSCPGTGRWVSWQPRCWRRAACRRPSPGRR